MTHLGRSMEWCIDVGMMHADTLDVSLFWVPVILGGVVVAALAVYYLSHLS